MLRQLDGGSVGPRRGALSPESMWLFGIEKWSTRLRFRIRRSLNSAGPYISGFGEILGLGLERPFRRAHVYISSFGPHFDLFFFTSSLLLLRFNSTHNHALHALSCFHLFFRSTFHPPLACLVALPARPCPARWVGLLWRALGPGPQPSRLAPVASPRGTPPPLGGANPLRVWMMVLARPEPSPPTPCRWNRVRSPLMLRLPQHPALTP
jgi:hypothetical protein